MLWHPGVSWSFVAVALGQRLERWEEKKVDGDGWIEMDRWCGRLQHACWMPKPARVD